ncbi:MAG: nucleotidyl transferase AbiEii/AbiGii toxin family protein [Euryarchaeota archaeon]|nr:nucleotidyl transferase AbiEii/AbiGii toxin family protein [Euryarchaeota archaeon]
MSPTPVYDNLLTRESERRLSALVNDLPTPVALAGGHAVRLRVRDGWQNAFGQEYFGSRDIDLAYFVDPLWSSDVFSKSAAAKAPHRLRELGFEPSGAFRFRLVLDEQGEALGVEPKVGIEDVHYHLLYVDPMVTARHPLSRKILGFDPIDEPLLATAFTEEDPDPRASGFAPSVCLPSTPLLVATKLHSFPDRTKDDKAVKDLCDLFALAAHGGSDALAMRKAVHRLLPDASTRVRTVLGSQYLTKALGHLDVSLNDYRAVVAPLALAPKQ